MIGCAFGVYVVGATTTWIVMGAWQQAVINGPRYEKRRKHMADCDFCQHPGWFWTTGYDCRRRRYDQTYPFSLSPWARLTTTLAWPVAWIAPVIATVTERASRLLAGRIEARFYTERDRREVERLVREMDGAA